MTDHLPKKSGMANLILKDRTPSLSALVFKAIYNQLTGIRYFHVMNISFFQSTSTQIIFSNKLDLKSIASYEYPMMTINEKHRKII
jgi:hypothetical protein